ncbi:molybdopterin converting factor subunit 1 [Niallia sp. XMNu-256]|uniref:molybdopterin converting factor subunit 1 n=1 Tax=Niallia sp. XMNu-256 TaxID=3082444 RepID=UPI0030D12977
MNNILFFAHLRDVVGQDHVEMEANGLTVTGLKQQIAEKYDLKVDNIMVSINEEFATGDDIIQNGDVIAFIPPVSGG